MTSTRSNIIISALLAIALAGFSPAQATAATSSDPVAATATPDEEDPDETGSEDEGEVVEEQEEASEEDENPETREGEVTIEPDDDDIDIDIPVPSFINQAKNHIDFNGADWSGLRQAVNAHKITPLSIINIGDSHIQADFGTAVTRDLLQYRYGNAGRGLITPLRMSGTNQPYDYTFSSTQPYSAVKLMKAPWRRTMGFTGTSISPSTLNSSITVGTRTDDDYDPFSSVTLFHKGQLKVTRVTDERGADVSFSQHPSRDYTFIKLSSPQTRVTIDYENVGDLTLFGANLSGDRPGVFYHTIGNNGATYDTYNRIGGMGPSIKALNPDLVIISLGTNEAFGRLDTARIRQSIDTLVKNVREANPEAEILLVTPMECHRTTTKTVTKKVAVKGKKRKGKRSRSRTRTVKSKVRTSGINTSIKPIRDEIVRYGQENGIAVYDWWEVAGGSGASNTWIKNGLFSRDKVHHSAKGYRLEGRLMYDALVDAFNKK